MVDLDELILRARQLSPLPASVVRLAALVGSSTADIDAIADVIAYDQALTIRLLRAANSAASGAAVKILEVREAMFRLGTARVLALAMAASVNRELQRNVAAYGLAEGWLWRHSVAAAAVAEVLPEFAGAAIPAEAFTAALLHDVGKLIMGRFLTRQDLEIIRRAQADGGLDALAAERQVLGMHHAELGGIVAQHWSLPDRIVKGITYHHHPAAGLDVICDAVYLANLVAKVVETELDLELAAVEEGVLERLGLASTTLPSFVTAARSRFESVSARYEAV